MCLAFSVVQIMVPRQAQSTSAWHHVLAKHRAAWFDVHFKNRSSDPRLRSACRIQLYLIESPAAQSLPPACCRCRLTHQHDTDHKLQRHLRAPPYKPFKAPLEPLVVGNISSSRCSRHRWAQRHEGAGHHFLRQKPLSLSN